jgi:hypothetical protein
MRVTLIADPLCGRCRKRTAEYRVSPSFPMVFPAPEEHPERVDAGAEK